MKRTTSIRRLIRTATRNGLLLLALAAASCREDELVVPTEYELLAGEEITPEADPQGLYLLNEGNMGSNKATIDFVDFRNAYYVRNLYSERNPTVVKELGDVGNDIQIYGSKLYAVINCSHKVEVMNASDGRRIGQVDIANCRYISFHKGYAYVSSYVGPVQIDPDAPQGAVYRIDTTSLEVTGQVTVGYQPEEMEFVDDYLYVANSGGYRAPNYDNTLSVVEPEGMKQTSKIVVAPNLHRVRKDQYGQLWVSSRGDYGSTPSRLFVLEKEPGYNRMYVSDTVDVPCSELAIRGDSLYFISTQWDEQTETNKVSYGIIDVRTHEVLTDRFITDGTEADITVPYGIALHPSNGDIYVADAKNYVSSGKLNCYTREGKLKWSVRAGDIPSRMVFLPK